jgi:hypothetical protein
MLIPLSIFSQQKSPYIINKCANNGSFQASEGLICSDELRTKWFCLVPSYVSENGKPVISSFSVIKMGIGSCSKNDLLVISFTDHSRVIIRSINFNLECETWIKFSLNTYAIKSLESKTIRAIQYVNGNEMKSFSYVLDAKENNFFINALTNYVIIDAYCR